MRSLLSISVLAGVFALSGCARSPAESFSLLGFRGMRVTFITDSSVVSFRDEATRFRGIPWVDSKLPAEAALRALSGSALTKWGKDCGSQFIPKTGSYDPRMGLVRAADGWNVGDPLVLRNYSRSTGVDYLVLLNRVAITRAELDRSGAGAVGKLAFTDAALELSVIDAKGAKRVWRSTSQARSERSDSLELLVGQSVDLAVDNFFVALPDARRWACKDAQERFK